MKTLSGITGGKISAGLVFPFVTRRGRYCVQFILQCKKLTPWKLEQITLREIPNIPSWFTLKLIIWSCFFYYSSRLLLVSNT